MVNAQEWLDINYPKEQRNEELIIHIREQLEGELNLEEFSESLLICFSHYIDKNQFQIINQPENTDIIYLHEVQTWLESQEEYNTKEKRNQIKKLDIGTRNLEGNLDLSDFISLEELDCRYNEESDSALNELTSLNITKCINLKELDCSSNRLSHLDLSKNIKLEKLNISGNDFSLENPTWLSYLVNLKELNLEGNKFVGSLEFTKNMAKLESLNLRRTNLTGLEYLPLSLKKIKCDGKIKKELEFYNHNLALWKAVHQELMKKVGQEPVILDYEGIEPEKVTTFPEYLQERLDRLDKNIIPLKNYEPKLDYLDFILRDGRSFAWENQSESSSQKKLPFRLYNLQTKQVEETKDRTDITNYLTLSYVWGNAQEESNKLSVEQKRELDKVTSSVIYQNSELLTKLGYKAWKKAIEVSQLLGINYFWMDQICINQNSSEDKNQEVPKMRQYYGNTSANLIAIDAELGEVNKENEVELIKHILTKIVTSPWFTRAWTFQEGLLSKQTIFMFDDYLVDGRILVLGWSSSLQEKYERDSYYPLELNNASRILITPLGWSYGVQEKQKVNLTSGEALLAVKHRHQTVPVDGIYALLGLLPYGSEVKVSYKDKVCSVCKEKEMKLKESINCSHLEKTKWPAYFTKDLEEVLLEVVKESVNQGHYQEMFSWVGSRSNNYWYIPQVQSNGSTSVERLINYPLKNMQISLQGIQLESEVCRIDKIFQNSSGGISSIQTQRNQLSLRGNSQTIERIQVGDSLVVIGEEKEHYGCLAILIPSNPNYPVGLVEFSGKDPTSQKIFADLISRRIIFGKENIDYYQKVRENKEELANFLELSKWRIIHSNFTEELVQKWKEQGFSYEQTYEWGSAFAEDFNPQEISFYAWLRDIRKLTAKKCGVKHRSDGKTEDLNLELRKQLIIEYSHQDFFNKFNKSKVYGVFDEVSEPFDDLSIIGRTLNWAKIEAILIKEIEVNYGNHINGIQLTYQVKSEGKWKLIKGERHGSVWRNMSGTPKDPTIIKLAEGEYLNKIEGFTSKYNIDALTFYTVNSIGEEKIYGSFGKDSNIEEKFSLEIKNDKQTSVFYGNQQDKVVYALDCSQLKEIAIQQIPHQLTKEDLELIAYIEIAPK